MQKFINALVVGLVLIATVGYMGFKVMQFTFFDLKDGEHHKLVVPHYAINNGISSMLTDKITEELNNHPGVIRVEYGMDDYTYRVWLKEDIDQDSCVQEMQEMIDKMSWQRHTDGVYWEWEPNRKDDE